MINPVCLVVLKDMLVLFCGKWVEHRLGGLSPSITTLMRICPPETPVLIVRSTSTSPQMANRIVKPQRCTSALLQKGLMHMMIPAAVQYNMNCPVNKQGFDQCAEQPHFTGLESLFNCLSALRPLRVSLSCRFLFLFVLETIPPTRHSTVF
jgi:hypothetical protein